MIRLPAILMLLLGLAAPTWAEDRIVATEVAGRPAPGEPIVPPRVITEIRGGAFEGIRQQAAAVVAAMGEQQIWSDFGPDSGFISVTIHINGKTHTVNSWYPIYKDTDAVAYVNGYLVAVESKAQKEQRELSNTGKHRTLIQFLDKILTPASATQESRKP